MYQVHWLWRRYSGCLGGHSLTEPTHREGLEGLAPGVGEPTALLVHGDRYTDISKVLREDQRQAHRPANKEKKKRRR